MAGNGVGRNVTAILTKSRCPSLIALNSATRSAHSESPLTPFSMFTPVKTVPSAQRSAAPTAKFEYGQYALARTSFASCSSSRSFI